MAGSVMKTESFSCESVKQMVKSIDMRPSVFGLSNSVGRDRGYPKRTPYKSLIEPLQYTPVLEPLHRAFKR